MDDVLLDGGRSRSLVHFERHRPCLEFDRKSNGLAVLGIGQQTERDHGEHHLRPHVLHAAHLISSRESLHLHPAPSVGIGCRRHTFKHLLVLRHPLAHGLRFRVALVILGGCEPRQLHRESDQTRIDRRSVSHRCSPELLGSQAPYYKLTRRISWNVSARIIRSPLGRIIRKINGGEKSALMSAFKEKSTVEGPSLKCSVPFLDSEIWRSLPRSKKRNPLHDSPGLSVSCPGHTLQAGRACSQNCSAKYSTRAFSRFNFWVIAEMS